ncbi:MAG TPA: aminoglycoside adenylyltransferase domain-containing protein [Armatimonadota bacterium]|nr:aminoglycoside adenylyltransferase domain-containing protein [Armatimonadota bacterium]
MLDRASVYATGLLGILGDDLIGVYLYGSLARGCYHAGPSDVDTIVVTRRDCTESEHPAILRVHQEAGAPVDAVFVTEEQLNADVFPTPISFLVKPIEGHKIVHVPEGRGDFLLQRQDAYEAGVALAGPDPREIMRPVPWPLLAECLDYLFPHIITRFKNPVLMLCRIAYAHANHSLCSKRRAGEWALETFEERWRPVISAALTQYAEGVTGPAATSAVLQEFEEYCAGYIRGLQSAVCSPQSQVKS